MASNTLQAKRMRSTISWSILFVMICCLQIIGTASHRHSADQHLEQRKQEWRLHQERQALEVQRKLQLQPQHPQQKSSDKSSKLWLINSYPQHQSPQSNAWAFNGWRDHLVTTYAATTTTSTTTPRPTIKAAKTPFPSLWNYAPKKGTPYHNQRETAANRTTVTRDLNPKHG